MTSPLRGVRLVALDLDGTLLPATKRLSDRAIGVIRDVRAAGIEVTLATGKGWNHTERYARELGLDAPLVALEGALVARPGLGDAAISSRTLSHALMRRVHAAIVGLDAGYFYCHDRWRTRVERRAERWTPQIAIWDPHLDVVDGAPGDDASPHAAFVYHLVGPREDITEARVRIAALDLGVDLFHAPFADGHDQLHVRPAGVDKHSALSLLLTHLGIAPSELLAAGDWWNDVGMLRMAGVAVAPANAIDAVRDEADHVLPHSCEEDAVARFLEAALREL